MGSVSAATGEPPRAEAAEHERARARMIEAYLPLVRSLARRFTHRGEQLEDLVQVGAIGLIKAIDRFEPARGVDFAAYAAPTILGEIKRHLRDRAALIRVPRREQETSARVRASRGELTRRLQRDPTSAELAAAAKLDGPTLVAALRAEQAANPASFADAALTLDEDEPFRASEDRVAVSSCLRRLHPRERQALHYRYFDDLSQGEIAARLGVSQTHASRLLASGLAKMRTELEGGADFSRSRELNSWHGDSRRRHGRAA
jgi:RNA polymerase sigma-B factor